MNTDVMLNEFIARLQRNAPALIVLVLCATMTLARRRRHPRSAFLAGLAFCWFLFVDLLALAWYEIGIFFVLAKIPHPKEVFSFSEVALSCLEALGYIFVVLALNAARVPYRPPEFYDDPGDYEDRHEVLQDDAFTAEGRKPTQEKDQET